MDSYDHEFAGDLERELMLPGPDAEQASIDAPAEVEREIQQHQEAIALFLQRAADARKTGRSTVAALQEQIRQSKVRAAEEQRRLADDIARAKALTAQEIEAAEKLAAGRRAALEALTA